MLNTKQFVEKAHKIHGKKYDYSKVDYINSQTKVCIICPIHGEFWQTPNSHLQGSGCKDCGIILRNYKHTLNTSIFIEKACNVHGNKYDYSKVEYINNSSKICIICPNHGEFWQKPADHLSGHGCTKCGLIKVINTERDSVEEFIEKARKIHGDKYDYSKVEYINSQTKICIICPTHGEFWQKPNNHLIGQGCPKCSSSHLENEIRLLLTENKIEFEEQKRFGWLGKQSLDFYLPQHNIAIECQGQQHFEKGGWVKSKISLIKQYSLIKQRDERKRKLCEENGVKLLYYSNLGIEYPYKVFEDKSLLIEEIKKK